jgi:hypothetical protein
MAAQQGRGNKGRRRACTSHVWNNFEEISEEVNGKRVRSGAKCTLCKKVLTGVSTNGTGHLIRHLASCSKKADRFARSQSVLQFSSDGSLGNWEYNAEFACIELCRMIARLDLPLGIGAYNAFVDYIKYAHNPMFAPVSRQTTTRDVAKLFNQSHTLLIDCLNACSVQLHLIFGMVMLRRIILVWFLILLILIGN